MSVVSSLIMGVFDLGGCSEEERTADEEVTIVEVKSHEIACYPEC